MPKDKMKNKTAWGLVVLAALGVAIGVLVAVTVVFTGKDGPSPAFKIDVATGILSLLNFKEETVLRGVLGAGLSSDGPVECEGSSDDWDVCLHWANKATVKLTGESYLHTDIKCTHVHWETDYRNDEALAPLQDCFDIKGAYWYGSAEMFYQHWPIDEWNETMTMYVSGDMYANYQDYGSVLERYWLSSKGVAIRVSHDTPLHVSFNENGDQQVCFQSTFIGSYYPNSEENPPHMDYTVCTGPDVRQVHDYMSERYVDKPTGFPDQQMIKSPIWSTWARYKIYINESVILDYADDILANGFSNSQIEIDDGYQIDRYGDFDFDLEKFPDASGMVSKLHDKGFRVTMWVHPFANTNSNAYLEGKDLGYFVKRKGEDTPGLVMWWNGLAGMLDVTNPKAVDWFVNRLETVRQDIGIDSYKFDAGETNYLVENFDTYLPIVNPCEYTTLHSEMAARLGTQIEVRAAFENQNLPVFVRMMDKDSRWGWDNGLKTLITTTLTFSILGYPYTLPDMIGGNVYEDGFHARNKAERNLYIRWLELTAFLPSMQFSISPWQYDQEVVDIAKKWVQFHEEVITPKLIKLAEKETMKKGYPLIRPLWWIAPNDEEAQRIDSQFLVGDDMMVAPIVENTTLSRDVYFPKTEEQGRWADQLHLDTIPADGRWIRDIEVPLDEVLYYYFERL